MRQVVTTDEPEPGLLRLFGNAIVDDFKSADLRRFVALVLVVIFIVFEWGPGNEMVVVSSLAAILDANDGPVGILLVGAAGFALVFFIQFVSGSVGLVGFSMLERTTEASWTALQRIHGREERGDWWNLSWISRLALGFVVGASAVGLFQQTATGVSGWSAHWRVVRQSAWLGGLATALVSMLIAGATYVARQFPATEDGADWLISVASNPLTWLGLFVVGAVFGSIRSRLRPDPVSE